MSKKPSAKTNPNAVEISGWGVINEGAEIEPIKFIRPALAPDEVEIKLLYCGICHSDIHHVYNEWKDSMYPMVPGHEMTGVVTSVGPQVSKFNVNDMVAVGNLINSCRICTACKQDRQQYCANGGPSWVYNGHARPNNILLPTGELTMGGYSQMIRVPEDFVLMLPPGLDIKGATPLLCAGITVFSALSQNEIKGKSIGIAGIGGLGHLAVKFAKSMGAKQVVAITRSPDKVNDVSRLGANKSILSTSDYEMRSNQATLDLIIDTIPQPHDIDPYLNLLKLDGKLWILGVLEPFDQPFNGKLLTNQNRSIGASNVGGIAETQKMLNYCAKNNITADVEIIDPTKIRESFEDVRDGDVRYRFIIDLSKLSNK